MTRSFTRARPLVEATSSFEKKNKEDAVWHIGRDSLNGTGSVAGARSGPVSAASTWFLPTSALPLRAQQSRSGRISRGTRRFRSPRAASLTLSGLYDPVAETYIRRVPTCHRPGASCIRQDEVNGCTKSLFICFCPCVARTAD